MPLIPSLSAASLHAATHISHDAPKRSSIYGVDLHMHIADHRTVIVQFLPSNLRRSAIPTASGRLLHQSKRDRSLKTLQGCSTGESKPVFVEKRCRSKCLTQFVACSARGMGEQQQNVAGIWAVGHVLPFDGSLESTFRGERSWPCSLFYTSSDAARNHTHTRANRRSPKGAFYLKPFQSHQSATTAPEGKKNSESNLLWYPTTAFGSVPH